MDCLGDTDRNQAYKTALWMLEAGIDSELISLYYLDNYLCSASKYELAEKVALNEFSILNSDNADGQGSYYSNGYSLYIDIPFALQPVITAHLHLIRLRRTEICRRVS